MTLLLIFGTSAALAGGDDPCPKPEQCFESDQSKDYGAYVRHLDHMIDTLVAPREPIIQLGTGHTTVIRPPDIPNQPESPLGDVWTEKGQAASHYIEHWFLDDPAGLPDPQDPFVFEFQSVILDPAEMAVVLPENENLSDTYIRMDLHYMEIPTLVQTEDLDHVGASVERHAFRGWSTDASGAEVVSCYLLRETHYDASNGVERRLDHWVLYGDSLDTILVEHVGDELSLEPLDGQPTAKTFYAWHQLNPNPEVKQAAIVEYSPLYGP
jgi:hypothetical protein